MKNLEYLATYPIRGEAEAMKGLLEENGIKCFLQFNGVGDALMGGYGTNGGPTEIWLDPENLEKARDLINPQKEN
jgi:hypothetical protein